ncbi:DUF2125 domain-containing protein [Afifella sp. H1R]|uniref:DUF2125 domain-containing protein n=1 Tax=Afifella sp. H1R TaxID=2908841 RepID=UPI001F27A5B4|nr:DUF2125 domain-containing protein [Afifella sp. H1R]MCF1505433.1 DUF2125 domain-containing protein [Afifella sp. H1R]
MRRILTVLAIIAVILAGLWSAGWYVLATYAERQLDAFLTEQARRGVVMSCPGRHIGGFPFRLRLSCSQPVEFTSAGTEAATPALAATVRAERPQQVETELASPLTIKAPYLAEPLKLEFADAKMTTGFGGDGLKRATVDVMGGRTVQGAVTAGLDRGQALVKPTEAEDGTSVQVALRGLTVTKDDLALPASDLALAADVAAAPEAVLSGLPGLRQTGLELRQMRAELKTGGARVLASGPLRIGPDGLVSGQLDVTITGIEALSRSIKEMPDGIREPGQLVLAAISGIGVPAEVDGLPARRLTISLDRGAARIAFINLGRVPPLF